MSSTPAPPPPLLLTKHLTTYLSTLLSPHLHTALLCSPSGKLLAHVSSPPRPIPDLRTQATVAASLTTLYSSAATSLLPALSHDSDIETASITSDTTERANPYDLTASTSTATSASASTTFDRPTPRPKTITVQLAHGALIVRQLTSGLLLVCLGNPPDEHLPHTRPPSAHAMHGRTASGTPGHLHPASAGGALLGNLGGVATSVDDEGSVMSAGALTTASGVSMASVSAVAVVGMKKEVEEFATRLEGRLVGLSVPEEGIFE